MSRTRSCVLIASVVLAGACSGTAADVETGANGGPTDLPTPTEETTVPIEATTVPMESVPEPGTRPQADPTELLLTATDLAGWQFSGPQAFPAEPTFESGDCELMNEAWAAHAQPGTRVRAANEAVSVRQAVVDMVDAAAAGAVLDAADSVWESCVELSVDGDRWWSEPVQMPAAEGWRASGLALGGDDRPVWIIGFWQQGSTIVFVDMDGDDVWTHLQSVFAAVSGRLGGDPAPVPETVETFPPPGDDWTSHPLASLAPAAEDLGDGWRLVNGVRNEAAPSDPNDEIAGCDVAPPPTLDGIELQYSHTQDLQGSPISSEVEILVGLGDEAEAQATVDAFRGVARCELPDSGFENGLELVAIDVAGADDAVMLRGRSEQFEIEFSFVVARFDGLFIGVSYAFVSDPGTGHANPTSGDIAALIAQMAAAR